jgi:pentatricopeptide repeat protein
MKQGNLKLAFDVHDDMVANGIEPDIVTLSALMDGLLSSNHDAKATKHVA